MGFFFFDDIVTAPDETRREVLQFLGADPALDSLGLPPDYNRKADKAKVEMTEEVRTGLIELYTEELYDCAALFGGPAKAWPAKYGLA